MNHHDITMNLKKIIFIAGLAILAGQLKGQGVIVYGRIRDTVLQNNCADAIVILLQDDSSLIGKTRSNALGYFKFKSAVPSHTYTLQVVLPAFESYKKSVFIPSSDFFDLGSIYLQPKSDTLKTAMVSRSSLMPKFSGDTLEYNTEKVRLRPYARVEDLLKLLPGLQIDADGNIFYNGTRIRHLLIDGEEVLGSSPKLITRNLDGNKIARVQVLDRKSDKAIFAGIDDGDRTKTINLVLKDSARHTYSGNVELGGDDNGHYNSTGFLVSFRKKEQLTAVGLASNVGNKNATDNSGSASNGMEVMNQAVDPFGAVAGPGIPQVAGGALHYANTWRDQEEHINGGYQYAYIDNEPINTSQTVQTLPDSIFVQSQERHSRNSENQQKGNVRLDYKPGASSALRFSFVGGYVTGQEQMGATGNSLLKGVPVNTSKRTIQACLNDRHANGEVGWRLGSASHPGRVFSVIAGAGKLDNNGKGYLYSNDIYYQANGLPATVDTTDQFKVIADHATNYSADLTYTEPLPKNAVLTTQFKAAEMLENPTQSTFDRGNGKYDRFVDSLSSQLNNRTINTQASIAVQGHASYLKYVFGGDWFTYRLRQKDVLNDTTSSYSYGYLGPKMRLDFLVSPRFNFGIYYHVSPQLPTTDQLSPVVNNNDPLHIRIGNPGLKPAFNQNLSLNFSLIKTWLLLFNLNMALMDKSITTRISTDSLGRQISETVNVAGGKSAGLFFSATKNILGVNAGFSASSSYTRSVNYVNADLSNNDYFNNSVAALVTGNVRDKISLQFVTMLGHIDQISSINANAPIRYWLESSNGSVSLYLIRGYEFNTNFDYLWQEKTNAFSESTSTCMWNSYVSRNFMHDKLVLRASINNLLNQSASINRASAQNMSTQSYNNILGRYWMLSVIYNFDKTFHVK